MLNVVSDFVKCGCESLVPVRYVAEVTFDPFSSRWYVEGEGVRTVVGDLFRVFGVA